MSGKIFSKKIEKKGKIVARKKNLLQGDTPRIKRG
jgi:hypothetical protein